MKQSFTSADKAKIALEIASWASAKLNWFGSKKNLPHDASDRRRLIDRGYAISLSRQAELLNIARSTIYAIPNPMHDEDLRILAALDKEYTDHPEYGTLKLAFVLNRDHGVKIGKDRLRMLRRILGLETIYPKPKTSIPFIGHKTYPYLLRNIHQLCGREMTLCVHGSVSGGFYDAFCMRSVVSAIERV